MAEVIRLAKPLTEAPPRRDFALTHATQEILRSLHLTMTVGPGAMTLIAGAPGVGKTFTLEHFSRTVLPGAYLHTVQVGQSTPEGLARALAERLELGTWQGLAWAGDAICAALWDWADRAAGPEEPMLLLDEAQNAVRRNNGKGRDNWDTLEWLRGIAEEHLVNVALCGGLALEDAALKVPQLWSRCLRRVVLKGLPRADVAAFLSAEGIEDPAIAEVLFHATCRERWLGTARRVIDFARDASEDGTVTGPDLLAACECFGLQLRTRKK